MSKAAAGGAISWMDVARVTDAERLRAAVIGGIEPLAPPAGVDAHNPPTAAAAGGGAGGHAGTPETGAAAGGGGGFGVGGAGGAGGASKDWGGEGIGRPFVIGLNGRPIMPDDALRIARTFLWHRCRRNAPGVRQWTLRRWGGTWWERAGGRWVQMGAKGQTAEESLRRKVWHWLAGFDKRRITRDGPEDAPFAPTEKTIERVLAALAVDTMVEGVEQAPAWVGPTITTDGRPAWGLDTGVGEGVDGLSEEHCRGAGLPDPTTLIPYRDGLLDLAAVVRTLQGDGPLAACLLPHDERLFSTTVLPFDAPIHELERLYRSGDSDDEIYGKLCPHYWRWLGTAVERETATAKEWGERQLQLQQMFGDSLDSDRSIEKVYAVVGVLRGGKDTNADALEAAIGAENVAALRFSDLDDRFGLYPLLGARVAMMRDASVPKKGDPNVYVELAKIVSGQGKLQVRQLYSPAQTNVRLGCRLWIFANSLSTALRDGSTAFANRLVIWPMTVSHLGKEDEGIKKGVRREGRGINLWALCGAIMLRQMKHRRIAECDLAKEWRQQFQAATAPMSQFLAEICCVGGAGCTCGKDDQAIKPADHTVEAATIKRVYERWCRTPEIDAHAMGGSRFYAEMKALAPRYTIAQEKGEDGKRVRVIRGVGLRPDVPYELLYGGGDDEQGSGQRVFHERD